MWQEFEAMIEKISSDAKTEWSFINDLFVKDSFLTKFFGVYYWPRVISKDLPLCEKRTMWGWILYDHLLTISLPVAPCRPAALSRLFLPDDPR